MGKPTYEYATNIGIRGLTRTQLDQLEHDLSYCIRWTQNLDVRVPLRKLRERVQDELNYRSREPWAPPKTPFAPKEYINDLNFAELSDEETVELLEHLRALNVKERLGDVYPGLIQIADLLRDVVEHARVVKPIFSPEAEALPSVGTLDEVLREVKETGMWLSDILETLGLPQLPDADYWVTWSDGYAIIKGKYVDY